MPKWIINTVRHRNFVLILAVIVGLIFGPTLKFMADISFYVLAAIMVVATTGFSLHAWFPLQKAVKPILFSTFLNYVLFTLVMVGFSYLILPYDYWIGFVIIAVAPPGVAIIPFTTLLKGDISYAVSGVFGAHLTAMFMAPAILLLFVGESNITPKEIVMVLVQLIIIPIIISRFLRFPSIKPFFDQYRGKMTNWGFFFVIAPIIGINRNLFFTDPVNLALVVLVFIVGMIILGMAYQLVAWKTGMDNGRNITTTLMLTIKSSAFAAVTAYTYFDEKAALPSAVMSVFVIVYFIVFPYVNWKIKV